MTEQKHPLDTSRIYAEDPDLLRRLQLLDWQWFEDPKQFPFLRIIKHTPNGSIVSAGFLDQSKQVKVVVGAGWQSGQVLVLAYRKSFDFTCEAYRNFPKDPTAKPIEAINTRILIESFKETASLMPDA